MADLLVDVQSAPATPGNGQVALFPHTSSKQWASKDDTGKVLSLPGIKNVSLADQVANAADTYLAGSSIAIPSHLMQVGTTFRWRFAMTKTGAGIAPPVWIIRVGTAGAIGDSARVTFTSGFAQTGVIDTGLVDIIATLRNVGAAGVLAGILVLTHNLAATGFATVGSPTVQANSAGFDTTVPNSIVGNPGSAGVWTHQLVMAEAFNL